MIATVVPMAVTGCSSKRSRGGGASTAAPINSGNNGNTGSGSTGGVATLNPPPPVTLNADALVASMMLDQVADVDLNTGTVNTTYATGQGPIDVLNVGTTAYVANAISQDITVVDHLANNVVTTIDVTSVPVTGVSFLSMLDPILKPLVRPTGLAATPNGRRIYSANLLNLTVIDGQSYTPIKSVLGLSPISLSGLIANPSQALSSFLASPVQGLGVAKVAATNDYALATCMISGKVMRINAQTDDVIDYVSVGRAPIGISIAGTKAYVACALSQEITVLDVATGTVLSTIQGQGLIPFDVATNQAQTMVYVANAMSGDVTVIDAATDTIVDTLPGGTGIASLFQQAGITLPATSSQGGGIGALLNSFLQGFAGGATNPASFGALITGGSGGGGLLSPASLINGLLTAFLSYAGVSQAQLNGLSLPGTLSVGVARNPDLIATSNGVTGDLSITEASTRNVSTFSGLVGAGPADIAPIWAR
ncbi:MAG: YncE family protein [Planctomycetes bacterium]|nr:YncE family protein [Planctomycetota bacterium]